MNYNNTFALNFSTYVKEQFCKFIKLKVFSIQYLWITEFFITDFCLTHDIFNILLV